LRCQGKPPGVPRFILGAEGHIGEAEVSAMDKPEVGQTIGDDVDGAVPDPPTLKTTLETWLASKEPGMTVRPMQ